MKSLLKKAGYVFNSDLGIWSASEFKGIAYNDGDEIESRIATIISNANDLSVLSDELRRYCTDWPSQYHLSAERANLLRPFEQELSSAEILEIGAGCGAITRYLGETGGKVLALEGSHRRASITRSRTHDLENVTVVSEVFDNFKCNHKFDVVTLIGVLEYASVFTHGDHPHLQVLKRIRQFLKPGGRLIIAIENQLGLKYFAGAPEDHLGHPMIGVEGRYRSNQPRTFGRETLKQLLKTSEFYNVEFLAPYPDYKFPVSIITEQGFKTTKFDAVALACQSVRHDPQMPSLSNFSLEFAYPEMISNKLGLDMANSFLVVATPKKLKTLEESILAYHYSTKRLSEFCKETHFVFKDGGAIDVKYKRLGIPSIKNEQNLIEFFVPEHDAYIQGTLLSQDFSRLVMHDGWSYQQVAGYISRYINILGEFGAFTYSDNMQLTANTKIPGQFFDVIPQNIIIRPDGTPEIIDKEWTTKSEIELGYLLLRSIMNLISMMTRFARPENYLAGITLFQFIDTVLKKAGINMEESDYKRYFDIESEIHHIVSGSAKTSLEDWGSKLIPMQTLKQDMKDRDDQIISLEQDVNDRESQITKLEQDMKDRNDQITLLEQGMKERESQITKLEQDMKDRNDQITLLEQGMKEREDDILSLKDSVSERDNEIAELNEEIVRRGEWALGLAAELEDERTKLSALMKTNSWRLTLPLREMRRWFTSPVLQTKRYGKGMLRVSKRVYQILPLNPSAKAKCRNIIARISPKLLLFSGTPQNTIHSLVVKQASSVEEQNQLDAENSIGAIEIPSFENPTVTVIIPVYGKRNYTLRCLKSIANHAPTSPFEVIVVDDCSPDDTLSVLEVIKGIRIIQNKSNQGFIRSCNEGARAAKGEYLLFLNNDTEVTENWMDALLRTFFDFPGTGLVGSKLVYPDGRLQEAGGIIWQDGSAWNFGRFQDPQLPVYNYAREVDYCSGASIMVPKLLFDELGGFDEHYLPAYCEDSDLALKIRDNNYRVIYQPLSTIIHYEGITSGTDTDQGVKASQVENTGKLFERWRHRLSLHQIPGEEVDNAKDRRASRRVLMLDHCTPTPNQDAGSVTIFNLMLLLREMDFQVTFIPEDNFLYMPEYTTALQRNGIEVLYAPFFTLVKDHLKEKGTRYELVFLFRPVVVERHLKSIQKYCTTAKVLYHTVDLHFLRMLREAELQQDKAKHSAAQEMQKRELAVIQTVDASIVHSTAELELLTPMLPAAKLHVFPLIMDVKGSTKGFDERKDIVFVGGYQHTPNVDAVKYFVKEIMPLLRKKLPGVRFFAVGSKPPEEIKALTGEDVIIAGFVENLSPLLGKMRISVAPLRFGAGIKGKIGTAMAVGLPVVATSLAAEGMLLTDGENILVADGAKAFADAIARVYQDESIWSRISKNALNFAEHAWGHRAAWQILEAILADLNIYVKESKYPLSLYSEFSHMPTRVEKNFLKPIGSAKSTQDYMQLLGSADDLKQCDQIAQ